MKLAGPTARSLSRRWSTVKPAEDEPPRVNRLEGRVDKMKFN